MQYSFVKFLACISFDQFADDNPGMRMDEDVELITEWPVKDSFQENDDSDELSVPTMEKLQQPLPQRRATASSTLFALRTGKRQHEEFASCNAFTGGDCVSHKRENDPVQCSSTVQQCEREKPHSDSGSGCGEYFTEVAVKAPRLSYSDINYIAATSHKAKEHLRNSHILCGSASECGTTDCTHFSSVAKANLYDSSVENVSAKPSKTEHCSWRESSAEVIGHQDSSINELVSTDSLGSAELLAQPRVARWWRRHGQRLVGFEQRGKTLDLPRSSNPNTLLFHVARSVTSIRNFLHFINKFMYDVYS